MGAVEVTDGIRQVSLMPLSVLPLLLDALGAGVHGRVAWEHRERTRPST